MLDLMKGMPVGDQRFLLDIGLICARALSQRDVSEK